MTQHASTHSTQAHPQLTHSARFAAAMAALPLVGILRGIRPDDAVSVGTAMVDVGWHLIEVPLNSPQPFASIEAMVAACPGAMVGAGTVLTVADVRNVHACGGQLVVSPNFNPDVVRETVRLGLVSLPGVITPSEAFAALNAGASGLKLFPAEMISPAVVKALRAVLSADTLLLPVGGIGTHNLGEWRAAGASGFGIGSALYKTGMTAEQVKTNAREFTTACRPGSAR